eukprot:TRINITY_DN2390_c0_g1_i8.p1 TRINITY_DN2390_c0_g1~~TRINITY_DN2390_c0_g1_i8.p1  ORF type:complete len:324 (+),score=119.75 TRINITY_DN2390_c0_g1_i8:668-1639(+)
MEMRIPRDDDRKPETLLAVIEHWNESLNRAITKAHQEKHNPIVKEGKLTEFGSASAYFVLQGFELKYKRKKSSKKYAGAIELRKSHVWEADGIIKNAMEIQTVTGETFVLVCESVQERKEWIDCIYEHVDNLISEIRFKRAKAEQMNVSRAERKLSNAAAGASSSSSSSSSSSTASSSSSSSSDDEETTFPLCDVNQIIIEGYLTKKKKKEKRGFGSGAKKRFCQVSAGRLTYYKTKGDSKPAGHMFLKSSSVSDMVSDSGEHLFELNIAQEGVAYTMGCADLEDKQRWMKTLTKYIEFLDERMSGQALSTAGYVQSNPSQSS